MKTLNRFTFGLLLFTGALLIPSAVHAQSTGSIAGNVEDTTAAALPGVTVEASSPVLIEGVRTAITDGAGNYQIIQLEPGTYSVTFRLSGFATIVREGIELTSGFTANVSAEMPVGGVEETITVTGASPVVDIQNTRSQTVLTREILDAMPAPQTMMGYTTLTLGASATSPGGEPYVDVGGSKGENTPTLTIHGMRPNDMRQNSDGMNANNLANGGGRRSYAPNQVEIQEVVLATSSASAETETGGMVLNVVPREGGNSFSTYFSGAFTNEDLQVDNIDDELRGLGLTSVPGVRKVYDWGVGVGGPIVRDKLWFYSANRWWGASEFAPGAFYNKSTDPFHYVPDLNRRGYVNNHTWDVGVRLTWQAAEKHKITFSENRQENCQCSLGVSSRGAPEASHQLRYIPIFKTQATWTAPVSNKLLFEAGFSHIKQPLKRFLEQPFPGAVGIRDLATGLRYAGQHAGFSTSGSAISDKGTLDPLNQRFSVSYVTGSHNFKVGQQLIEGFQTVHGNIPQQLGYFFLNGVPNRLTQVAGPYLFDIRMRSLGLYAQDQWTLNRLTLNIGLRFDSHKGWAPGGTREAGPFVPAFAYDGVTDIPNFKDVTPRLGVAYDLFGDGRTAFKGSIGRYVGGLGTELAVPNHPLGLIVTTATRSWNDANEDFVTDCDLTSFVANGECGALSNSLFGKTVQNTFYDKSILEGWGNRPYMWHASLGIQHELRPGLGLDVSYYRTVYGNFIARQNTRVAATDFDPYCVTAPADARLPGGGGNEVCGLFDVNPASYGSVQTLITSASEFGDQEEKFDGVDIGVNARLGNGGLLRGGVSIGRKTLDTCFLNSRPDITPVNSSLGTPRSVTTPRVSEHCRIANPWSAGTQVKANGVYPLPWWGLEPSFTFQNLPGKFMGATWSAPNAVIAPSLGRNLSAGASRTARVQIIAPSTVFLERVTLLDVRLAKVVNVGGARVKGVLDVYNMFNANTILNENATYGGAWQRPLTIVAGRLFKFGVQVEY